MIQELDEGKESPSNAYDQKPEPTGAQKIEDALAQRLKVLRIEFQKWNQRETYPNQPQEQQRSAQRGGAHEC
jgi:hypothetical protein